MATAKFDQAVHGSQQLVLETIVDDKDPTKIMAAMASLAFSPGLPPLAERVPPAKRAALLEAAVKKSGFPPQALDRMETWAAAFILLGNQFRRHRPQGPGRRRRRCFATASPSRESRSASWKPTSSSSASSTQLPEKAQRAFLEGAIEPAEGHEQDSGHARRLVAW